MNKKENTSLFTWIKLFLILKYLMYFSNNFLEFSFLGEKDVYIYSIKFYHKSI